MRFKFSYAGYAYEVTGPLTVGEAMERANQSLRGLPTPGIWMDRPSEPGTDRSFEWVEGNFLD